MLAFSDGPANLVGPLLLRVNTDRRSRAGYGLFHCQGDLGVRKRGGLSDRGPGQRSGLGQSNERT